MGLSLCIWAWKNTSPEKQGIPFRHQKTFILGLGTLWQKFLLVFSTCNFPGPRLEEELIRAGHHPMLLQDCLCLCPSLSPPLTTSLHAVQYGRCSSWTSCKQSRAFQFGPSQCSRVVTDGCCSADHSTQKKIRALLIVTRKTSFLFPSCMGSPTLMSSWCFTLVTWPDLHCLYKPIQRFNTRSCRGKWTWWQWQWRRVWSTKEMVRLARQPQKPQSSNIRCLPTSFTHQASVSSPSSKQESNNIQAAPHTQHTKTHPAFLYDLSAKNRNQNSPTRKTQNQNSLTEPPTNSISISSFPQPAHSITFTLYYH